ncbi:MAG TPA: cation transporter [Dehalococcoidia bacterium]|nr:cation transporter [Dehalococcoidia bacterium]
MERLEFEVRGMTCDHCVASVRNAIEELPGVQNARVDLDGGSAVVEGEQLDRVAIVSAVQEEGYEAIAR